MQTIFIDRKKEIEEIVTALKNLKERGQGRAILITGEPGIGKTRLLLEAGKIASEERILVAQQKCTPENKTPFGIVKAIVRELTKKLETGELEQLLPVGLAIEKEERVIAMEGVVSEQYRIFENLYRNLVELSKHSPLCLLLDDLQWADSGTIGFLHYLARNIGKTKIVVLATASELDVQNQFLESTVKAMNVEKILKILRLKPLSPQDTATLVKESLKIEVSEKMLKKLHEKTSGNPLFILEIVESLRERAEKMESLERVMIPQTLRAAYQKRIETLDKNSKEIMCLLSVFGREFSYEDATAVLEIEEDKILDTIEKMMEMGFLGEREGERYLFLNNPIYEILYSMVPTKRAHETHEKIAKHLIATKNREEYYEEIARHLSIAGKPECADYYLKSAEYYLRNFGIEDCLRNAQLALEYAEKFKVSDNVLGDIYTVLGYAFSVISDFKKGIEYYWKALKITTEDQKKAELIFHLANDYTKMAMYEDALAVLTKIPSSALENPNLRARALFVEGSVYFKRGDIPEAMERYSRAIEILKNFENKELKARILNGLGVVYQHAGNYSEAEKHLLEAYEIRKELKNMREIASSCNGLGLFYLNTGVPEKGLPYLLSAEQIYSSIGDVYGLSIVINNIGIVYWARGDYSKALEYFEKEIEYTEKIGDRSGTGYGLYNIGTIYDEMGEYQKALEFFERAEEVFGKIGEKHMAASATAGKACMLAALGEHRTAEELIDKVLKEFMNSPNSDDLAVIKMMKGRILTYASKYAIAEEFFYDVIDYFENQNKLGDLTTALIALGKMYIEAGEKGKARNILERALEVAEKIDSATWKKKITELMTKLS